MFFIFQSNLFKILLIYFVFFLFCFISVCLFLRVFMCLCCILRSRIGCVWGIIVVVVVVIVVIVVIVVVKIAAIVVVIVVTILILIVLVVIVVVIFCRRRCRRPRRRADSSKVHFGIFFVTCPTATRGPPPASQARLVARPLDTALRLIASTLLWWFQPRFLRCSSGGTSDS